MRIVIDLQAAQSASRNRGIGRYSIALAKAMLRHRGQHEILIALNGMFAETVAPLRATFAGLIEDSGIRVWSATVPSLAVPGEPCGHRRAAELMRETFLASLQPDVLHVASLFESSDYFVASINASTKPVFTAVTLYDLIPHLYPESYLNTAAAKRAYDEKLTHLRAADLWLAISESSRREGIDNLGLPPAQVVTISSAADEHFSPGPVARDREVALRRRYGLWRPFVMYTGGIDHRKNVEGLISAWAALPTAVKGAHQLAIVCSVHANDRSRLEQLMLSCGLHPGAAVLTGFVPEEDLVDLYRLCKLFVFPSHHEGFGLPALEAMRCGAPVIGADNSSIPEVIGREEALFDSRSQSSITAKMLESLQNDAMRARLVTEGLEQASRFNWDRCAVAAIEAFEHFAEQKPPAKAGGTRKPRLALVSPMPPQRSGVADSNAELLPYLAAHYEIDLVVEQPCRNMPEAGAVAQRTPQWFMQHGHCYDRVLYQFGNSDFHDHMLALLDRHPGVVILHDFYLSGLMAYRELHGDGQPHWFNALYASHGWPAVSRRVSTSDRDAVIFEYPANFEVLRQAQGIIVHSEHAARLARSWYGVGVGDRLVTVPLLRTPAPAQQRASARKRLGLGPHDFIVCSFGHMSATKLNHRLLRAWQGSALARAPGCRLVFVGEPDHGVYGKTFDKELAIDSCQVQITGWVDRSAYQDYLHAADMAVQLRALSRGETSAAVLDCMNHGLATIANREGSMADLDAEAVCLLEQNFADADLSHALEALWHDPARRAAIGMRAREIVHTAHAPRACAASYAKAIETFSQRVGPTQLARAIGNIVDGTMGEPVLACLARAISQNLPEPRPARQLLIDMTNYIDGARVESPFPVLLRQLLDAPERWRTEPVYQTKLGGWRYARKYMLRTLACKVRMNDEPVDPCSGDVWCMRDNSHDPLEPLPPGVAELGLSVFRMPDKVDPPLLWAATVATARTPATRCWFLDISELVQRDWQSGIQRVVKNYLLEFLLNPPPGTTVVPVYAEEGKPGYRVAEGYVLGLAGVKTSQPQGRYVDPKEGDVFFGLDLQPMVVAAQADFLQELRRRGVHMAFMVYDLLPLRLPDCFIENAASNHENWLRAVAQADLALCISGAVADEFALWLHSHGRTTPSLPRIATVHLGADLMHSIPSLGLPDQSDQLLEQLREVTSFLMVGTIEPRKSHAEVLAAFELLWLRGSEAKLMIVGKPGWQVGVLIERLHAHPERGRRLFWIEDASDQFLEQVYAACACLIAASKGEGFGLPLIEAAQHKMSVIARDLPVFREVGGNHAFYFHDDSPEGLARALSQWLELYRRRAQPLSDGMPWQTWAQSAQQIKQHLLSLH